jgi:outer membrane protein assembly factor BamB
VAGSRRDLLKLLGLGAAAAGASTWLPGCTSLSTRTRVPLQRERFTMPAGVLRIRWSRPLVNKIAFFSYKPQEFATAAVSADGRLVYIGSSQKRLFAFRSKDGEVAWECNLESAVASHPLYIRPGSVGPEALLVLGDDEGLVTALEADSGQKRWSYRARGPVQTLPVVAGNLLYVTSNEGRVYALDVRTGAWRWSYERETPDAFSIRGQSGVLPVPGSDRAFVGFPDGYIACLNGDTGEVMWTRQLSGEATRFTDVDGTPALLGDTLLTSCYASGFYGLDPKDGTTRWRFEIDTAGSFTVDRQNERIYVVSATQGLFCLDKKGRKLWQQVMTDQGELSAPTLWRGYLLVSAAVSGLHVADAATGELLQYFDPGQGASAQPVAHGSEVYLLSNAGSFFALTAS